MTGKELYVQLERSIKPVLVKVTADGSLWNGHVRHKDRSFATVRFKYHAVFIDFDITYDAAAYALTNNRPIGY